MSDSNSRRIAILAALVLALVAVLAVVIFPPRGHAPAVAPVAAPLVPVPADKKPGIPSSAPQNVYIGQNVAELGRTVLELFTTRKREVLYQALVKYTPVPATWDEVPGISEVLQYYTRQNKELPHNLFRVDTETEMSAMNLGEPLRFVTSVRLYMNPLDGRAIAYDMAQTTGGQPQRMLGHVSPRGVSLEIYRGGQVVDRQDLEIARETFIPVDFDFIHLWYEQPNHAEAKKKMEPIRFSIFVPEAMAQVMLVVRPLPDQTIPVGNANYNCAHYEVTTYSTKSAEGLSAKQEMWFDRFTSRLMKRQDFDPGLDSADAPVTEREPYQNMQLLSRLSPLPIDAPTVPERDFSALLDTDMYYTIAARDANIGRVTLRFGEFEKGRAELPFLSAPPSGRTPKYYSRADVRIDTDESSRHETAVTLYDQKWRPIAYETRGDESAGLKLTFDILAGFEGGRLNVHARREAILELKRGGVVLAATAGREAGFRDAHDNDEAWRDPLRRVAVSDDDAQDAEEAEPPRLIDQSWSRPFPEGAFISDFNRVEHLLLLAHRLPLPKPKLPPPALDTPSVLVQKAALFLIRQNRAGVALYEIKPEPKPKLTERQKRRLLKEDLEEPPLFVATSTAALLPSRMLLSPDGRILQLNIRQGAGDVTYTLDDPIMRRRAERERVQKLQEGPRLLRPPWW